MRKLKYYGNVITLERERESKGDCILGKRMIVSHSNNLNTLCIKIQHNV